METQEGIERNLLISFMFGLRRKFYTVKCECFWNYLEAIFLEHWVLIIQKGILICIYFPFLRKLLKFPNIYSIEIAYS